MAEVIVFPDVEDLLRAFLDDTLPADVAVYATSPAAILAARSATVVRTGGVARDLVTDRAIVAVDCRAKASEAKAFDVARLVRAHLTAAERDGMLESTPLYEVSETSGPYLNPDPTNPGQFRFTVIFQVAVRGSVV